MTPHDMPAGADLVRYKGCACPGTSSGPRDVFIVAERGPAHRVTMLLVRVAFACDVCDEPWSDWQPPTALAAVSP